MTKFPLILLVFLTIFSSGCAKIANLSELLRIKSYGEEKDGQALLVKKQNEKFEKLMVVVKRGDMEKFSDKRSVWMAFGQPIFETKVVVEDKSYQVWMYRHSTKLFGSNKVYLYFDAKGKLKIYDYSPGGTLTSVIEVAHDKK